MTEDPLLPEPPERVTTGRYAMQRWSYKGEIHEWPITAQHYAKDLLSLAADTIERWPYTEPDRDRALVAAMRRFVG